jgi:hypothetical protein
MINYLLNLKLVNGGGKFSVNLQVAGRPITEKSVSIRQQFANSVHKIFVFASAAKAASHSRRKRPQKADFHRDAVKSGNCSRLDDRASDDIEVFIMAR